MPNVLPFAKRVRIVSSLVEGCSLRATERLCEVSHATVISQAVAIGEACRRLHNALMRGLQVAILELDEIWAFIAKKQKRLTDEDPPEYGDNYTFIAMAATQKAIVSYLPGKRDALTANDFVTDLRGRIVNRPQITTDGLTAYLWAIGAAFGADVDYAQIIKEYGSHARLSWARRAVDADRIHADRGRALELLREAIRVGIEARDLDAELISGHVRNGLEAKEEIARLQAENERLRALVGGAGR